MELHNLLNYNETQQRLNHFLKKESGSYNTAAIISGILGVIAFFIFPLISLVFVFAAGYLIWEGRKNKSGYARLHLGKVVSKRHHVHQSFLENINPTDDPIEAHFYELVVDTESQYMLLEGKAQKDTTRPETKSYKVNELVYNLYQKGEDIGMVLSPANDLLGYAKANNLVLLLETKTFSDGSTGQYSKAIPQNRRSSKISWELVEEV